MDSTDIFYICERISNIFFIPIRIYDGDNQLALFGFGEMPIDPVRPYLSSLLRKEEQVCYFLTPFYQCFGVVVYENLSVIIGPLGTGEYTMQERKDFAFLLGINEDMFKQLYEHMRVIPK